MAKLIVFNFITVNGLYKGSYDDITWHRHGEEEGEYSMESLRKENILVFGRITYQMMEAYWANPLTLQSDPVVAKAMNDYEKIVFSRTLEKAEWNNTRLISDNMLDNIKKLKKESTKDLAILGSGSLVNQLTNECLVDEYQLMIDPIALGEGTPLFKGITQKLELRLTHSRVFKSGVLVLTYEMRG